MRLRGLLIAPGIGPAALSAPGASSLLAITAVAVAFWPVLIELAALWSDTDRPYSHGALVGPISLWLAVRACLRMPVTEPAGSWIGLVLFAGAGIVWLAALSGDFLAVQILLFPVLLLLAVTAVAGWTSAWQLTFPIGFLYLAVPIWNLAVPVLQAITVAVVGFVVGLIEIPVFVEGAFITIPEGVFQVSDGCAGLHYFIVALTISSLFSYLNYERQVIRAGFVLVAAGLALLSNWIRVGSLVLFGHYSDMQHYLITHEHYYYGWVLYALMLIPTFMFGRRLFQFDSPRATAEAVPPRNAGTPRLAARSHITLSAASVALILVLLQFPMIRLLNDPPPRGGLSIELPAGDETWVLSASSSVDWQPHFAGADAFVSGTYEANEARVDAFIAVYTTQSPGREVVGSGNRFFESGWLVSIETLVLEDFALTEVQQRIVRAASGSERLIWSWYSIGETPVASDTEAKLRQLLRGLLGRESGAVVLISSPCVADCSGTGKLLERFLRAMGPSLASAAAEYQEEP